MRQVVDLVRGKQVDEALNLLSVLPQSAAVPVRKTLKSATANALAAEGTAHLKSGDLRISRITVDGGPMMKRIRPMGMGRAYRINKRLCHLSITLSGEPHEVSRKETSRVAAAGSKSAGRTDQPKTGSPAKGRATKPTAQRGTGSGKARSVGKKPRAGKKDS
jgi:large subunit ribosomal protein L22